MACKFQVSNAAVAYLVSGNPGLKCLRARGCRNLSQQESDPQKREFSFSYSCRELHNEIGRTCMLEEIALGWGFSYSSLEALKPAITSLRKITVGLGGLLGEDGLRKLPTICPMLESIILYFQVFVMVDLEIIVGDNYDFPCGLFCYTSISCDIRNIECSYDLDFGIIIFEV